MEANERMKLLEGPLEIGGSRIAPASPNTRVIWINILVIFVICTELILRRSGKVFTFRRLGVVSHNQDFEKIENLTRGPFSYQKVSFQSETLTSVFLDTSRFNFIEPNATAIVFLFHGCNRRPDDFFSFPEELRLLEIFRERGYVPIAFPQSDEVTRCWNKDDVAPVVATIAHINNSFPNLRKYAFGASSGGSFITRLARATPLEGLVVQISPGAVERGSGFPPTAFVWMTGDKGWAGGEAVSSSVSAIRQGGGQARDFPVHPWPFGNVSELLQRDREWLNKSSALALIAELRRNNFVTADGVILGNSRSSAFQSLVRNWVKSQSYLPDDVKALVVDGLLEVANAAFGQHEITHERVSEAFSFLDEFWENQTRDRAQGPM